MSIKAKRDFTKVGLTFFVFFLVMGFGYDLVKYLVNHVVNFLYDTAVVVDKISMTNQYIISKIGYYILLYLIGGGIVHSLLSNKNKIEVTNKKIGYILGSWTMITTVSVGAYILCLYMATNIREMMGSEAVRMASPMIANENIWVVIFGSLVFAPIFEELIFRKWLISAIYKYGEKAAVFTSGLLYGLFFKDIQLFLPNLVVGCMLAYVFLRTGKVIYCIGIHFLVNLTQVGIKYLMTTPEMLKIIGLENDKREAYLMSNPYFATALIIMGASLAIIAIIGIVCLIKGMFTVKFYRTEDYISLKKILPIAYKNIGMGLCFILYIGLILGFA